MAMRHVHPVPRSDVSRPFSSSSSALPSRGLGVVVGIGTDASTAATQWATHEAATRHITLTLVVSGSPASHTVRTGWECLPFVKTVSVNAPLQDALIESSAGAEIVAMGANYPHAHRRLGSLVRRAHSNVAIIPDAERADDRLPVVVVIDGAPASQPAIRRAFDEASRRGVGLIAVHTWKDPEHFGFPVLSWSPIEWANDREQEREVLAERLAGFQEVYPDVFVQRVTLNDCSFSALVACTRSSQLVVVGEGTTANTTRSSTAYRLATTTGVPVLVAKK